MFNATGRVLTKPGWRVLTPKDSAEEIEDADEGNEGGAVPALVIGTPATATTALVTDKTTRAPSSYTQASHRECR
jgi:DNA topoisomerase IA